MHNISNAILCNLPLDISNAIVYNIITGLRKTAHPLPNLIIKQEVKP